MHIINKKTRVCDSSDAQSVLSLPAMYFKSVPNFENKQIYIPANYYSTITGGPTLNNNYSSNKSKGNASNENNTAPSSKNPGDIENKSVDISIADPTFMNSSSAQVKLIAHNKSKQQRNQSFLDLHRYHESWKQQ